MGNKRTELNKKWQDKNKDYATYLKYRSTTRSFIKNRAKEEDLNEFEELIKNRRDSLKNIK